jgi:hypothetical protein
MDDLSKRFQYHPPRSPSDAGKHHRINDVMEGAARALDGIIPKGREHALVLTKLEEARMRANAALAHARADEAPAIPRVLQPDLADIPESENIR